LRVVSFFESKGKSPTDSDYIGYAAEDAVLEVIGV
jgi:hypothetical protein